MTDSPPLPIARCSSINLAKRSEGVYICTSCGLVLNENYLEILKTMSPKRHAELVRVQ